MTDDTKIARLAEYRNPPVIETALGIEFAPIAGWNLLHFGALWQTFRAAYPNSEIHPGVPSSAELQIIDPPIRFFFINRDGTELVQLRSGAFVRNWRARPENEEYPRYHTTRPSFEHDLEVFYDFLKLNGFSLPEVWKCEVTYVNHFLRGREWDLVSDLWKVLPVLSSTTLPGLLTNLTQVRFALNYQLADDLGSLQIQMTPGLRSDGRELMQLTLTAFGKPRGSNTPEILAWLDQGRQAVVQGFSDFTSHDVQTNIWGRIWP